jgi:acetylornithine deacetylase/succinyl-diaminopimelate desuccinylase-like protein
LKKWLLLVALAVAVAAVVVSYRLRVDEGIREMTYVPRDTPMTAEMKLLQEYVRLKTVNPPGNETIGAEFLIRELRKAGVEAELIRSGSGRANVYARVRGEKQGGGLLLLHHIDVAPPGEGWTVSPFAGTVKLGMLWGRGALDMKSVGICWLAAFSDVARSGVKPQRDLVFLATADEEKGGDEGVGWLVEHRPDVFEGIAYALNEGGITEMTAEKLEYFGVEIGSKQHALVKFSSPDRDRLRRARIALLPYYEPRDPLLVSEGVRTYLGAIAPRRVEQRELLADIGRTIDEGKFWLLPKGYRTLMQEDVKPNGVVADGAGYSMEVLVSALPERSLDEAINRVRSVVAPFDVRSEILEKAEAPIASRTGTPFFVMIEQQVRRTFGATASVGPYHLPAFSTDSRFLRAKGITVYGVWPFLVDFHQTQSIHGVDERVTLERFRLGPEFARKLVTDYVYDR